PVRALAAAAGRAARRVPAPVVREPGAAGRGRRGRAAGPGVALGRAALGRGWRQGFGFAVACVAVGVAGLVALGALAERISRFIEGGHRFVLGQISVAGEGMGMGAGFTAGGLLRAAKIAEIARVRGVAAAQPQVMLPLKTTRSQFLTLTQE